MKKCKKCFNAFKSSAVIGGKHYSFTGRSYCLDCSPLGARKGYDLRKEKTTSEGKTCPVCNTKKTKYYKNNVCSTCRAALRRHKNRMNLKKNAGGQCSKCKDTRIEILQFHHLNPDNKQFTIASFYANKNLNALKDEASKCALLCPNCHALEHLKDIEHILTYYQTQCGILDSNQ